MVCSFCKKEVDLNFAVFWNGAHWHRGCAVMFQKKEIVKIEKKLKSSGITQIHHAEQTLFLKEAKEDLKCLIKTAKEELKDIQELGKVMVRRGFGKRCDTNKRLESGKISHKQLEKIKEIKELYLL